MTENEQAEQLAQRLLEIHRTRKANVFNQLLSTISPVPAIPERDANQPLMIAAYARAMNQLMDENDILTERVREMEDRIKRAEVDCEGVASRHSAIWHAWFARS